jgi:pyruvate/oxaloacetate carboxyltransferase
VWHADPAETIDELKQRIMVTLNIAPEKSGAVSLLTFTRVVADGCAAVMTKFSRDSWATSSTQSAFLYVKLAQLGDVKEELDWRTTLSVDADVLTVVRKVRWAACAGHCFRMAPN